MKDVQDDRGGIDERLCAAGLRPTKTEGTAASNSSTRGVASDEVSASPVKKASVAPHPRIDVTVNSVRGKTFTSSEVCILGSAARAHQQSPACEPDVCLGWLGKALVFQPKHINSQAVVTPWAEAAPKLDGGVKFCEAVSLTNEASSLYSCKRTSTERPTHMWPQSTRSRPYGRRSTPCWTRTP